MHVGISAPSAATNLFGLGVVLEGRDVAVGVDPHGVRRAAGAAADGPLNLVVGQFDSEGS
jgi:hypothetical protein